MKTISIVINISGGNRKVDAIRLEKKASEKEVDVLASAMTAIFLNAKEAVKIVEKAKSKKSL